MDVGVSIGSSPQFIFAASRGREASQVLALVYITRACFIGSESLRVSSARAPRGGPAAACHPLVFSVPSAPMEQVLDTEGFGFPFGHYFERSKRSTFRLCFPPPDTSFRVQYICALFFN